ncbi:MAG: hypothetical protein B7Y39_07620 [Bdellovibrio sp. 28-41-41]|nr:MAG: hypothetical protein B7Y39_07620 [Bdellovibrio sp. 28-41-41]
MGIRFRRNRNKWIVDIYLRGKRTTKCFDSEEGAILYEKSVTGSNDTDCSELKQAIHRYFHTFSIRKAKPQFEKYMFSILFEYLQELQLKKMNHIKLEYLQSFQTHLLFRKMKPSSVNRMFNTYKHFFNCCVDWGMIAQSPALRLKSLPESRKIERQIWSDEQISSVVGHLTGWARIVVLVIAYTGMRPCEVMKLEWNRDIDFNKEVIRAASFKGQGSERERWISIHPFLSTVLKEWRLQTPGAFAFPSLIGKKPINSNSAARVVRVAVRKLGLKGYTLYGMRHSFATRAIENGVDLNSVRELMGHSNFNMTKTYLRVTSGHLKRAVNTAFNGKDLVTKTW